MSRLLLRLALLVRFLPAWWGLCGQVMTLQAAHGKTLRGVVFKAQGLVAHARH